MAREEKCRICEGTGHTWCRKCNGVGRLAFNPWEAPVKSYKTCDRCQGSGRDPDPDPACRGTGIKLVTIG